MFHRLLGRIALCLVAACAMAGPAAAAVPQLVNYQGTLADSAGQPLHGSYSLTFKLYATSVSAVALWTETQAVTVTSGVFHVVLGSTTPLTPALFAGSERWLGIAVNGGTELSPRTRVTSVPWAQRAAIADSVVGGGSGGGDGDWIIAGDDLYAGVTGNVGIGATAPARKLQIGQTTTLNSEGMIRLVSRSGTQGSNRTWDVGVPETDGDSGGIGYSFVIDDISTGTNPEVLVKWGTGYVGVGTATPDAHLDVYKPSSSDAACALRVATGYLVGSIPQTYYLSFNNNTINATRSSGDTSLRLNSTSAGNVYLAEGGGNVGIGVGTPGAKLDVAGTARVDVLEIAGADLAEKFPMSEPVEPGTVVSIDATRPGFLTPSRAPYDRRLAGVISGANGLSVGAVLGRCTPEPGAEPVAMSGRVWTLCDATTAAIEPGDLLTTSARSGHAMKATDGARSHGAVLGKAMSRLAKGRSGYVLVLVNLQ